MTAYLLDTVALSATRVPGRNPGMQRWVESVSREEVFISSLTLGELEQGIAMTRDRRFAALLQEWFADVVAVYQDWTLPLNTEVARVWGRTVGDLARQGRVFPVPDSMLAATALVHNLTIVTRNVRGFEEFGVATVNPWEGEP